MLPHTKSLFELIKEREEPSNEDFLISDSPSHSDPYDQKILQLKLKKKHQANLLRRMMQDAGYEDLARMTTLARTDYDNY